MWLGTSLLQWRMKGNETATTFDQLFSWFLFFSLFFLSSHFLHCQGSKVEWKERFGHLLMTSMWEWWCPITLTVGHSFTAGKRKDSCEGRTREVFSEKIPPLSPFTSLSSLLLPFLLRSLVRVVNVSKDSKTSRAVSDPPSQLQVIFPLLKNERETREKRSPVSERRKGKEREPERKSRALFPRVDQNTFVFVLPRLVF